MNAPRTPRQREVLAYIAGFIGEAGYSPGYQQIADGTGMAKSQAFAAVDALEIDGFLKRVGPPYRRMIEVITRVPDTGDLARLSGDDLQRLAELVGAEMDRRGEP